MVGNPAVTIYPPTELVEQVESYQERHDISSMSAAWIELTRRGLQSVGVEDA